MVTCLNSFSLCRNFMKSWKLKGKTLYVQQADAPTNILWENLEVGKCQSFCRSLVTFILVVIIVFVSFIFIFILRAYSGEIATSFDCIAYEDVKETTLNDWNIVALDCFCATLGIYSSYSVDQCTWWRNYYVGRTFLSILISMIISFVNYGIKQILKKLAVFERYKTITGMNRSILLKLFFAITLNMVCLIFFVNLNL